MITKYRVDFTNTGYIEDGVLTIIPDKNDGTEFTFEALDEHNNVIAVKKLDATDIVKDVQDSEFAARYINEELDKLKNQVYKGKLHTRDYFRKVMALYEAVLNVEHEELILSTLEPTKVPTEMYL